MADQTFIDRLADSVLQSHSDRLSDLTIILPNRRAKVFLLEALGRKAQRNIFAPAIISIEDFVTDISGIRAIDNIELLFDFYDVYLTTTAKDQQPFEQFANWAKTLLQDFNEIDRYLLNPAHVLSYLKDIDDIKHWSLDPEKRTPLIERHLEFWSMLPEYYSSLYAHLLRKGTGYQGLIYREAISNLDHFTQASENRFFVFAGFNALNAAEEKILQHFLALGKAEVFWDADKTFLEDNYHDAALFLRRFKDSWPQYRTNSFNWIDNSFASEKEIHIIGTPKSIGQARIAGKEIEQLIDSGVNLNKTAIVLGEESLLIPLLYSLPEEVPALNITMGYPAKNNPVQILISKIFRMHGNAISRKSESYTLYYKDVLDVLTHPLIEPFAAASSVVQTINNRNYTFFSHRTLIEIAETRNEFFDLLFEKWDKGALSALNVLSKVLLSVKANFDRDDEQDQITKAFSYSIFKVINKLISHYSLQQHTDSIETLHAVYKQIIDLAEVSFEGEPMSGLQIMGVLESRVLDFETVIITSMNEGKFPAGKSQNSFIPYDVKRELGLPTYKEKDAIYTYHFYHLLQRAKKIVLLYNTESDGLDGGEKSRFITQLLVEKQPTHIIKSEIFNPLRPKVAANPVVIEKSEAVLTRLQEIAAKGFSPSALTSYIRDPLRFYYQKILRINEVEEVEENIALNTLGTIIHEALLKLYEPLIGVELTANNLQECVERADAEVHRQFREVYKEGEIRKGKNLLAFEVAKRHVRNLLKMELKNIEEGDRIRILYLEKRFERLLEDSRLPYPVLIGGSVDRVEERNGNIRIIDYKTGKVEAKNLCLDYWSGLTDDIKNDKIIQVLAYAFMIGPEVDGRNPEAGIISFKNMKNGFLPFTFKQDKISSIEITTEILDKYIGEIVLLLNEILDPNIPFTQKTD
ncbi:MAG: PD-(D/E)XK nuclease family protein [Flavobacterium sp.]|nr:MAG: PD-(D/E)XK nuclease family protein [Flavobacterium sp.]